MIKIKKKIKERLRKFILRVMRPFTKKLDLVDRRTRLISTRESERRGRFVNDIRFNMSVSSDIDIETKRIMVAQMSYGKTGHYPDILHPKLFSEKVLWYKLYYDDPRISICADKYRAKEYIDEVLGAGHTVPLIRKYDEVHDIDLDELPDRFVLKVNWCTGCNIVVKDKSTVNIDKIRAQLDFWRLPWRTSYYGSFNKGYESIEPVIFAEEYVDIENNSTEYKLFCFNGKLEFVLVELDYFGSSPKRAYYDRQWSELPLSISGIQKTSLEEKPATFDEMVELAEKLAEPFPYVRVDFYDIEGSLFVGEMTFYSGGGFSTIDPPEWDGILGERFDLSDAMKKMNWNR